MDNKPKKLSVIFPIYNEKNIIENLLKEWGKELDSYGISYDLIICEDGSTDGTKRILEKIPKKNQLILNQKEKRRGYGNAVLDGIKISKSDYVLCVDADGSCNPSDLKQFWQQKAPQKIIIGWRLIRKDPLQRRILSNLFKSFFRFCFPSSIHDPSCPYVLFPKNYINPYLHELHYLQEGFWWGFVATCLKHNLSIIELPINHRPRIVGKTKVYLPSKIPSIALRNTIGLLKLKFNR